MLFIFRDPIERRFLKLYHKRITYPDSLCNKYYLLSPCDRDIVPPPSSAPLELWLFVLF